MSKVSGGPIPKRGFPVAVGTEVTIPADAVYESIRSLPSHDGPALTLCTRLKEFGKGRFEFSQRVGKGKAFFLPKDFRPGATVRVTWVATNGKSFAAETVVDPGSFKKLGE